MVKHERRDDRTYVPTFVHGPRNAPNPTVWSQRWDGAGRGTPAPFDLMQSRARGRRGGDKGVRLWCMYRRTAFAAVSQKVARMVRLSKLAVCKLS